MYTTLHKVILKGQDLDSFLQRIITQDIKLCRHQPMLSAICNPYGKVVITFWIQINDTASIWVDQTLTENFIKVLQFYDPFSELSFQKNTTACKASDILEEAIQDPWALCLIKKQIMTITPDIQNKYTPHILGLDKLNAISFSKGCFIGHEPISRTQFKGKNKREIIYQTSKEKPNDALNLYHHDKMYHYLTIQSI